VKKWPNLFIVGAGKSGTTSLHHYLKDVPDIYLSPVKEPDYFSKSKISEEKYHELFKNAKDEKIIGESSTSYFTDPEVPHLIYEKVPDAHILISLRNPIDKIYSRYLMLKEDGVFQTSFHEHVKDQQKYIKTKKKKGIQFGLYYDDVKRYLDVFGKDQVKIIIFEEWVKDPKPTLNEILKFLGVSTTLDNFKTVIYNPYVKYQGKTAERIYKNSLVRKIAQIFLSLTYREFLKQKFLITRYSKPTMDEKDREELKKFFYDDVQKLQTLLGRELPWKDFNT